jgi:hypothetical protein
LVDVIPGDIFDWRALHLVDIGGFSTERDVPPESIADALGQLEKLWIEIMAVRKIRWRDEIPVEIPDGYYRVLETGRCKVEATIAAIAAGKAT